MAEKIVHLDYKTPEKHSFEEFKTGCILVPLDSSLKFDKWKGNGAKANRERFREFLREGVIAHNPGFTKKQQERLVDETVDNFITSVSSRLNAINPCVAVAYPLNNIWIITFLTDVFQSKKTDGTLKNLIAATEKKNTNFKDHTFVEIAELNFDPLFYTYTIMQRAAEDAAINEVYEKSKEEVQRFNEMQKETS